MNEAAQRIAKQWGDNLRSLRIGSGTRTKPAMTQTALANRIGVTGPTVWRWEHGHTAPPLDFMLLLSAVFNVPPAMLFPLPQVVVKP